jgi:hypothetical protein
VSDFTPDEVRALKSLASLMLAGGRVSAPAGNGGSRSDELSDSFLDSQPWCDRSISKDPKRWAGESMVGRRYSEAPSEWLEVMADALEFKAMKGREDPSPRLQTKGKNAGKPWHEADSFEAKICRAWARRNKGKPAPAPKAAGAVVDAEFDEAAPADAGDYVDTPF